MKKIIILFLLFLLRMEGNAQSCINFEGNYNLNAWDLFWIESKTILSDSYHSNYFQIIDDDGPSAAVNTTSEFSGNWLNRGCLCFDYKVNWTLLSTSTLPVKAPKIGIFNGGTYPNITTRAIFVGNATNPNLPNGVWQNFCLPIGLSSNGSLPSNTFGTWAIYQGTTALTGNAATVAWDNLIQNVTGFLLYNDYNMMPSEKVGFDNFCWGCPMPLGESCNCTNEDIFTGDPYVFQDLHSNKLGSVACGGTLPIALECNKNYSFDIPTQWIGVLQAGCSGADSIVIKKGTTVIASVPNHPISYTFTTSGTYSVNYFLKKNGVVCRTCIMYFNVNCPPPCICPKTAKPTLSWQAGTNIDLREELALTCGETLTDKLDCFKPYLIGLKNPCGETCTPEEVITKITYPNGSVVISNNLNGADLIANQVGTYTVSMKVKCNGKWCNECIVKFKQTKKCEPPCDNCKEKVGAKFNKNASSATVSTYPAATTINATISLDGGTDTYTEVRANIVDFNIFAENNACLKSYTSPNDWGSIVAGTLGGFNPIVTNYAGVNSSSLANNPREIVFGSQSPVAIASNAPLNLTIKIPGVNPLSCCCINSTIFVKITYRNNKCEECSKIIRIDANQCPDTDKGGTINFNPIAGSPQFRTQGINKTDAESLKSASKTGLKK